MVTPGKTVLEELEAVFAPVVAMEAQLREMSEHVKIPVYQQVIRKSEKVPESTVTGSPLSVYSPRSAAGVDFRRWVRELWGGAGHEQV